MKRFNVGTRIIISFIFIAILTTIVGISGYQGLKSTKHYLDNSNDIYIPSIDYLAKIRFNLRNIVVAQRTLMSEHLSSEDRKKQYENFENARVQYRKAIENYEKLPQTPEEANAWEDFKKSIENGKTINDEIMRLMSIWENDLANKEAEKKLSDLVLLDGTRANNEVNDAIAKVIDINIKNSLNDKSLAEKNVANLNLLLLILAISAPLLSLIIGFYISSTISKPLNHCLTFATSVSNGDLSTHLETFGSDEVAKLGKSLKIMVNKLKEKIAEADSKSEEAAKEAQAAREATALADEATKKAERAKAEGMLQAAEQLESVVEIVTSASEQLSAQIEQSSRGTEEQTNRIGETATAMKEMNATVMEVAKNASNAASTAEQAKVKAEEGSKVVSQVVQGIEQVQHQSEEMKNDMGNLGKQAEG